MPLNIPGILVPFQAIFQPKILLPSLIVKDLRYLDFPALHRAGYRGAVFDKDNCVTLPGHDRLVPELKDAWDECRRVFGSENVLIVSNSAGTHLDAGGIQAESVSYHLGVPVLHHPSMKPSYSCIRSIRTYFASLPKPIPDSALVIVGDRIFTDIVLANRMRSYRQRMSKQPSSLHDSVEKAESVALLAELREPEGPLAIWTTGVWKREATVMRFLERKLTEAVRRWSKEPEILTEDKKINYVRDTL